MSNAGALNFELLDCEKKKNYDKIHVTYENNCE